MNTNNAPFRVGQKVEFLNRVEGVGECLSLEKGNAYTVDEVRYGQHISGDYLPAWYIGLSDHPGGLYIADDFAPIEENRERIKYVAVSETLREKAQEVVIENLTTS